jgi:hypothetical protein
MCSSVFDYDCRPHSKQSASKDRVGPFFVSAYETAEALLTICSVVCETDHDYATILAWVAAWLDQYPLGSPEEFVIWFFFFDFDRHSEVLALGEELDYVVFWASLYRFFDNRRYYNKLYNVQPRIDHDLYNEVYNFSVARATAIRMNAALYKKK